MTPRSAWMNLKTRRRILSSSWSEVALEADLARELVREAQALVVGAQLLRVAARSGRRGGSPSACAAICVPMARPASITSMRVEPRFGRGAVAGPGGENGVVIGEKPPMRAGCCAAGADCTVGGCDTAGVWGMACEGRPMRRHGLRAPAIGMSIAGPIGDAAGADIGGVVDAGARRAERDVVAVSERPLADDPLAIDVRAVQTTQVAQNEAVRPAAR